MTEYIATFYSHFGAIRFKKGCEKKGLKTVIAPVPRTLSSSCGTCVRFQAGSEEAFPERNEELEQIVKVCEQEFISVYQAEES